jgi:hypothetical protein
VDRIFVSHVWRSHHEYYWGLVRLLDQANHFKFVDLSVPKLRPFDGEYAEARDDILRLASGQAGGRQSRRSTRAAMSGTSLTL